jgi:hypothetical protein
VVVNAKEIEECGERDRRLLVESASKPVPEWQRLTVYIDGAEETISMAEFTTSSALTVLSK